LSASIARPSSNALEQLAFYLLWIPVQRKVIQSFAVNINLTAVSNR